MLTSRSWRQEIRAGRWRRPTHGLAPGDVQANLVILPQRDAGGELAAERAETLDLWRPDLVAFLLGCSRNHHLTRKGLV